MDNKCAAPTEQSMTRTLQSAHDHQRGVRVGRKLMAPAADERMNKR
jgi:hypothetical protein